MASPGALSRLELATPYIVRGVRINGDYLFADSCTVHQTQDIEQIWLIQGGPRAAIANIGKKYVGGQIVFPIRVDRDGAIEPAVQAVLNNAQTPSSVLRIDTNHAVSHTAITAEHGGTDSNSRLSFDSVIVQQLKIEAGSGQSVKVTVDFSGFIESRSASNLVAPDEGALLGRAIGFPDCDIRRRESAMRNAYSYEVSVKNKVELPAFITPMGGAREDSVQFMGVSECQWEGIFKEVLRRGAETETYIHGGWMKNENLAVRFGPVVATFTVPLFKQGEQPLTSKLIERTTSFRSITKPGLIGNLFSFDAI